MENNQPPGFDGRVVTDLNGKIWWYIDGDWHTCQGIYTSPPTPYPA